MQEWNNIWNLASCLKAYCDFQKRANSEVQKPTDVCVFRCQNKKKIRPDFFVCWSLQVSLQIKKRVNQPFHISSEVNKTIRRCYFSLSFRPRTEFMSFLPYFPLKNLELIQVQGDRSTHFPCTANYKNENKIKRLKSIYLKNRKHLVVLKSARNHFRFNFTFKVP